MTAFKPSVFLRIVLSLLILFTLNLPARLVAQAGKPPAVSLLAAVPTPTRFPEGCSETGARCLLPDGLDVITPANAAVLRQQASIAHGPWQIVNALAWSPDGQLLAVSAGDAIRFYHAADQESLANVQVGALTQALAFSPDGSLFAAGSRDGRLRVWHSDELLVGGEAYLVLDAHKKGVNCLAFDPVHGQLVSGGNDAVARFWDIASGELLATTIGGTFAVPSIAFSPDGAVLAVVNGEFLRLREVGSERIVGTFRGPAPLYTTVFSPDGEMLAAGDTENRVRLWDVDTAFRTGQEKYPPGIELTGHSGRSGTYHSLVWRVVFSPDGALLASAGGDGRLRLWEMPGGEPLSTLAGHTAGVTALAFRPDGRLLASGSLDGFVRLWGVVP